MARIVINQAVARATAMRFTEKEVRDFIFRVEHGARLRAMVGEYTTGAMASQIRSRVWKTLLQVHGTVYSDAPYGRWADTGARPHVIRARNVEYMRFYWRKVGRVVYFKKVNHPGQKGKHWLTEPLRIQARLRGWRVITDR